MAKPQLSPIRSAPLLAAGAAALSLSACSGQDEGQPDAAATSSAPAGPLSSGPSSSAPAVPATTTAPPLLDGTIPRALRGRWGLVPADCTSTHGDAKGLMEVGARTLTFYESRATLKSIRAAQPARLRADYAFTGEGQEWTLEVDLRSWKGGAQLIRQDRGPDALPGPLTYTRCAG